MRSLNVVMDITITNWLCDTWLQTTSCHSHRLVYMYTYFVLSPYIVVRFFFSLSSELNGRSEILFRDFKQNLLTVLNTLDIIKETNIEHPFNFNNPILFTFQVE